MTVEVVELKTGARMSHQAQAGQVSSTTLFKTHEEARRWIADQGLQKTHQVLSDVQEEI